MELRTLSRDLDPEGLDVGMAAYKEGGPLHGASGISGGDFDDRDLDPQGLFSPSDAAPEEVVRPPQGDTRAVGEAEESP